MISLSRKGREYLIKFHFELKPPHQHDLLQPQNTKIAQNRQKSARVPHLGICYTFCIVRTANVGAGLCMSPARSSLQFTFVVVVG